MKNLIVCTLVLFIFGSNQAQNDTIYGLNFTTGNLQFASLQVSTGNTSLYGNGPVTPDRFQGGVYDFDPIKKRYFFPRGNPGSTQLVTLDAKTGKILYSPRLSNPKPSVIPLTNIAYNWMNDTLYGTHHANEFGETWLRFAKANIQTGKVDIINNTPISTTPYIAGNTDIDPINGRYFLIDGSSIKTIDIYTGTVISNVLIKFPQTSRQYVINIAYNWSDGLVYGLYMYPGQSGSYLKLATLDPFTGQLNVLSQNPLSQDGITSGDCDIDVIGNRYFYIRQGRLYLVDITTGSLIKSQTIQNPNSAIAPIINMAYDDLMLPQLTPAALNLQDTIIKDPGETVQVNAFVNSRASYNWSDGSTTPTLSTDQPGSYSVEIISDGFKIYGETRVVDRSTTSIEEQESSVKVYPNPANGAIHLELTGLNNKRIDLQIIAVGGRTVLNKSLDSAADNDIHTLDVSGLSTGYYRLNLKTTDSSINRMFFVE